MTHFDVYKKKFKRNPVIPSQYYDFANLNLKYSIDANRKLFSKFEYLSGLLLSTISYAFSTLTQQDQH